MAFRHAQGIRGLDGNPVPVQTGPPPPPPTREQAVTPHVEPAEIEQRMSWAAQKHEPLHKHPGPTRQTTSHLISVFDLEHQTCLHAEGDTLDEAIQDAVAQYENAQPVKPLVFLGGDGAVSTLDPMTRSILTEALILFEASASGQGAPASTMTMLARVKLSVTGEL